VEPLSADPEVFIKILNLGGTVFIVALMIIYGTLFRRDQKKAEVIKEKTGNDCLFNSDLNAELWRSLSKTMEKLANAIELQTVAMMELRSELTQIKIQNTALQTSLHLFNSAFSHIGNRRFQNGED